MFYASDTTRTIYRKALSNENCTAYKVFNTLILKCDEMENFLSGAALIAYRDFMIYSAKKHIIADIPKGSTVMSKYELEADLINILRTESNIPEQLQQLAELTAISAAICENEHIENTNIAFGANHFTKILEELNPILIAAGVNDDEINRIIMEFKKLEFNNNNANTL